MKPGSLLISKPFLGDPHFERSVVLLCHHTAAEGTFGLVLTRPLHTVLGDVLALPPGKGLPLAELPLWEGGPVEPDTLHLVHQVPDLPGATPLGEATYWGGDFDELLARLGSGAVAPAAVRLFVGYSGWSAGQLAGEIAHGSWIRQPASAGKVFTLTSDTLWQGLLREKGGRYRALSNYPLDPRLN